MRMQCIMTSITASNSKSAIQKDSACRACMAATQRHAMQCRCKNNPNMLMSQMRDANYGVVFVQLLTMQQQNCVAAAAQLCNNHHQSIMSNSVNVACCPQITT